MKQAVCAFCLVLVAGVLASCGGGQPPAQTPVVTQQELAMKNATPPAAISTPVPIVRAHVVAGAGRSDPFIALFGPSTGPAPKPKTVAVSAFPNIPTLPGFESAPGGQRLASIWDGVRLTGVLRDGGYTAIVEAAGKSFIVRAGDYIADRFRVMAIGPDSVTLSTAKEERHFTLGG